MKTFDKNRFEFEDDRELWDRFGQFVPRQFYSHKARVLAFLCACKDAGGYENIRSISDQQWLKYRGVGKACLKILYSLGHIRTKEERVFEDDKKAYFEWRAENPARGRKHHLRIWLAALSHERCKQSKTQMTEGQLRRLENQRIAKKFPMWLPATENHFSNHSNLALDQPAP